MNRPIVISFVVVLYVFLGWFVWQNFYQPPKATPQAQAVAQEVTLNADKLWNIIQNWRAENNLRPYNKKEELCEIAIKRAAQLPQSYNHEAFLRDYKNYPVVISENIAHVNTNEEALSVWLASKPHAAALRKDFPNSCIATNGVYVVQIFSY